MLKNISTFRLRNIRSITDSRKVSLPQLSLLVGKNGSGKSSFMRFFQMLSQSFGTNKRSPILFYGDEVDFGSFEETISNNRSGDFIEFGFELETRANTPSSEMAMGESLNGYVSCKLKKSKENTYLSDVRFRVNDDIIKISFSQNKVNSIAINSIDFSMHSSGFVCRNGFIIPEIYWKKPSEAYNVWRFMRNRADLETATEYFKKYTHTNTSINTVREKVQRIRYSNDEDFIRQISGTFAAKSWIDFIAKISTDKRALKRAKSQIVFTYLPAIISAFNDALRDISRSIFYIGPFRAPAQRYYRMQELDVSKVDPSGNNVPNFINSLTSSELEDFKSWSKSLFGFIPSKNVSAGHISVSIEQEHEKASNLADVGFGYSQVLPILIQLWQFKQLSIKLSSPRRELPGYCFVFLIEQPELHLHPAFQRKLLRAILATLRETQKNGVNLKLILETHSETIINELGRLIEQVALDKSEAAVYLFEKSNGVCTIKRSTFDSDGRLMDWPYGFFSGE